MKIVATSPLGYAIWFVRLFPSPSTETSRPIVRMVSNPTSGTELTEAQANVFLPIVRECYPTASIEQSNSGGVDNNPANQAMLAELSGRSR